MWTPHSSTKTSDSGFTTAATITLQVALWNPSRSVATRPPFSWFDPCELWHGTWGRATHRESRDGFDVLAAVPEGEVGVFSEVIFEQLPRPLVQLRSRSGPLLRGQGFSPLGLVHVAFDEERLTEKVRAAFKLWTCRLPRRRLPFV